MKSSISAVSGGNRQARILLYCGIAAGPVYVVVGLVHALLRPGFDMRRHALSLLSNGDLGWVQISNFLISGILVIAGATGLRKVLRGGRAGTWAPILLAAYGLCLIAAGIFVADPGAGFPPDTPARVGGMSRSGLLHFVFGAAGFYALIVASFVFARRFWGFKQKGWSAYCIVTGVGFLISFAGISSGPASSATMLSFYAAVFWIWVWHTAVYVKVARESNN